MSNITRTCAVEGCERDEPTRRDLCGLHYQRLMRSGTTESRITATAMERFTAGLVRVSNGCLEWTGLAAPAGYGLFSLNGRNVLTHRFAWTLANGPIPPSMFICHHCDNPPCCDNEHLFLGTPKDNTADMIAKGRYVNAMTSRTVCPQRHPYSAENTYTYPDGRRECRTCSAASSRFQYAKQKARKELDAICTRSVLVSG